MAINPALLIAAPMLQDYIVDKILGRPLAAGVITCYQDNARTRLKNWYYQSGTPGNYTYIPLDNPLTLSSVGTITDPNGFDTIPFYYPYSETDNLTPQPYYITVNGVDPDTGLPTIVEFTRANFPYNINNNGGGGGGSTDVTSADNLIANNVFYHNIGTLAATDVTNAIIAPSQHDGFQAAQASDVRFIKSKTGANDTITFMPFGLGNTPLSTDVTPEYYLNFTCAGATTGETSKAIQIPISLHVKTLESQDATFTIQAQNVGGSANNTLTINIFQFLGSGGSSPAVITLEPIVLTPAWTQYEIAFTFPSAQGLTVGGGGDDALFLQIQYPLNATCDINFTKPSIYLGDFFPAVDFLTYDQIDTIINSPRTGDFRLSLNDFFPWGWVPTNDGTIGNASSNATTRANIDTWQLYYLIWTAVGITYAPMFESNGTPVTPTYGTSAISDWNLNRQLSLTKQLGRVLASVGRASGGSTTFVLGQTAGGEGVDLVQANLPTGVIQGQLGVVSSPPFTTGSNTLESNEPTGSGGTMSNASFNLNTGAQAAVATYQPTTFVNVFLKL